MKRLFKFQFLLVLVFCFSCNNEELFVEEILEIEETAEVKETEDEDEEELDISLPCDFSLSDVEANSTVVINCVLDLDGDTINLPDNVTLVYEGGEITNGTLNLSEGVVMDGNFLNSTLTLTGSSPQLKDSVFEFIPSRWGIVEGVVPVEIAYNNYLIISTMLSDVKKMGVNTFEINKMDAYFEYSLSNKFVNTVFEIPSDFHFKMSDSTFLRIMSKNSLMKIYKGNNIKISGGHLIGDRKIQNEQGYILIEIKGGQNVVIENVNMSFSSHAGLTINSYLFPTDPDYISSKNILITNCKFDSNASNNFSITDGEDITIENSTLFRAGIDIDNSMGVAPRCGIVIEPFLGQKVERVIIRNNVVKEGVGNAILAAWGDDFLITGNEADGVVGWNGASNVKIIDNPALDGGIVGGFGDSYTLSLSTGNIISGNTINNAATGLKLSNDDIEAYDNSIIDCKVGIMLVGLTDSNVYNNEIINTDDSEDSFGINAQKYLNNVIVNNNNIKLVNGRSLFLTGINSEDIYQTNSVDINNNVFDCGKEGTISYSNGINITENSFNNSGFGITSSNNILLDKNSFLVNKHNGQAFSINNYTSAKNITISNNTFINESENYPSYGIRLYTVGSNFTVEDNNILIQNNKISVRGFNYGIHSVNFNSSTIKNNKFEGNPIYASIYFRGDDSFIQNNEVVNEVDVEGSNNLVSNNLIK